ncbi:MULTISPECIES: quinate dehydrogenase [unclassified Vibrio]|uniref:shikimate dehydrogenase family protein n=1 Tax=unclassified Vibrio TaxID=2614977 RepID=UPI0010A66166|nr:MULTISPECIES: quinate dehydrogenase [unclassified Vibrio]WGY47484.1 quinate dehydrogenase [Vibrio sp. ABG19]
MKLGLIGQHIQKSKSPQLHELLGKKLDIATSYDLFDCKLDNEQALYELLKDLKQRGYRGVNVTHPYKVWAWNIVANTFNTSAGLGALNTLIIDGEELSGTNTDCSGFVRAYQKECSDLKPGKVLMKGAGGVGRAIAFGLGMLEVEHLYIFDENTVSLQALVSDLQQAGVACSALTADAVTACALNCDGLVNATPVGHYTTPGASFSAEQVQGQRWVFDAVYTPVATEFICLARAANMSVISGFELFIHQGVDAYQWFSQRAVDSQLLSGEISVE